MKAKRLLIIAGLLLASAATVAADNGCPGSQQPVPIPVCVTVLGVDICYVGTVCADLGTGWF